MKQFFKKLLAKLRHSALVIIATALFVGSVGAGVQFYGKAGAQPTNENVDYFLKIDGIAGESKDKGHEGAIDISSYAWAKEAPGLKQNTSSTGGGGGTGRAQLQDFHFTTQVNKSSPKLMESCASGKHFKEAVLTVRKKGQGQQDFLTIKLSDVQIGSYRTLSPDGGVPIDEFSLSFVRAEFSYVPVKADGSSHAPVVGAIDFKEDSVH